MLEMLLTGKTEIEHTKIEKVKLSLFANDIFLYLNNPRASSEKR